MKNAKYPLVKIYFLLAIYQCCFSFLSAQTSMNLRIKFNDTIVTEKYENEKNDFKHQQIFIEPGDYRIVNPTIPRILNEETITQVDLIYSDFPAGENFAELNRKRIIELFMYCPNAFNKQTITWKIIKQTGVKSNYDLKNYFHGFVIYYRPLIPFEDEKTYFKHVLDHQAPLKDSTILKVLGRNKQWKEMLCVADVTGSMSPYSIQLLVWAKFNETQRTFKQFVFFNDDEEKSNDQTKGLDSSGIWSLESFKADKVYDKMIFSMEKGQHYENDLEAIFYAVKKYPNNIKNIILIADNWEDPCDMYLLPKLKELKIPIKIIICGVNSVINTKYLEIARATNGSVHTMEEDLIDMGKMNEGAVFKISGLKFRLVNGKFIQIQ